MCESRTLGWGGEHRYSTERWSQGVPCAWLSVTSGRLAKEGLRTPVQDGQQDSYRQVSGSCPSLHGYPRQNRAPPGPPAPFAQLPVYWLSLLTGPFPMSWPAHGGLPSLLFVSDLICRCPVSFLHRSQKGCSGTHISLAPLLKTQPHLFTWDEVHMLLLASFTGPLTSPGPACLHRCPAGRPPCSHWGIFS